MKNYRSLSPKVKDTIATFIKAAIIIALILLAFNWLSNRYNFKSQLSKVSGEVWLGTITAIAIPVFQWYKSQEKEEIKLAQKQAEASIKRINESRELIKQIATKLETRINGVLMQVDGIRSELKETVESLQATDNRNLELDEKIDQYRHQVLTERLDIVVKFYSELCSLHSTVSYIKGQTNNTHLPEIAAIANDIQKKKADLEPDRPDDPGKIPLDCKSLDDSTEVNQC